MCTYVAYSIAVRACMSQSTFRETEVDSSSGCYKYIFHTERIAYIRNAYDCTRTTYSYVCAVCSQALQLGLKYRHFVTKFMQSFMFITIFTAWNTIEVQLQFTTTIYIALTRSYARHATSYSQLCMHGMHACMPACLPIAFLTDSLASQLPYLYVWQRFGHISILAAAQIYCNLNTQFPPPPERFFSTGIGS